MKKISIWLTCLALILSLCACGTQQTDLPESTNLPAATDAPAQEETAQPMPTLSPEAKPLSALSGTIQPDENGTLYTTLTRGDGLIYFPDLLPEDFDYYIFSLLVTEDTIYFAAKDEYFSLEPASLYAYDLADGTVTLLTQDGSAGCAFCLVGETLFYESYEDTIRTIELAAGQDTVGMTDSARLLDADNNFFYYAKADGGIYRNDSTLSTEALVMSSYNSYLFFAQGDDLCDIAYQENGTLAVLEFRDGAGSLRTQRVLAQTADGLYAQDGIVYVPQTQSHSILLFDMSTQEQVGSLSLPEDTPYCLIQAVTDDTLYYQTVTELYALSLDGSSCEVLGEIIYGY